MRLLYLVFILCFSALSCRHNAQTSDQDRPKLNLRISKEPPRQAPLEHADASSQKIYQYIYDSLLQFAGDAQKIQPALAESWSFKDKGLILEFQIRKNVYWHNGEKLRVEDVKSSIDRWRSSQLPVADALVGVKEVRILSPTKLQVHMHKPYYRNLFILGSLWILPEKHRPNSDLIGTGPYRMSEWQRSSHLRLEAFSAYWGVKPSFQEIQFHFINDDMVSVQALKKGIVDVLDASTPILNQALQDPELRVHSFRREDMSSFSYIAWNLRHPLLSKQAFRKVLSQAFPWDEIKSKLMNNLGDQAKSYFHSSRGIEAEALSYNLDKARSDLEDFKKENSSPLRFELLIRANSLEAERIALVYQRELKKIGIEMRILKLDWAAFLEKLRQSEFDAYFAYWHHAWESDPYHFFHSEGATNYGSYRSKQADELLEMARSELNTKTRNAYYSRLNKLIWTDLPVLFLFEHSQALVTKKDFLYDLSSGSFAAQWTLKN